jgi:LacI family transcriptional regulator
VCLDRIPDRVPVDSVSVEDQEAAEMGVAHLIANGMRRIAITTGPLTLKNERRRLQGYRQALERAGIAADEKLIWQGNLRPPDITAASKVRLANADPRPDSIFCTNGQSALGVLRAFHDCGIRTPEDIGFATFDELTVDDLFTPSVTTVVQPSYDIGFRAADLLLDRIEGVNEDDANVTIRLPATLKIRNSSRARQKSN